MFPAKIDPVSVTRQPTIAADELNGPNVIAAVLLTDPAGEAAGLINTLCRAYPRLVEYSVPALAVMVELKLGV